MRLFHFIVYFLFYSIFLLSPQTDQSLSQGHKQSRASIMDVFSPQAINRAQRNKQILGPVREANGRGAMHVLASIPRRLHNPWTNNSSNVPGKGR